MPLCLLPIVLTRPVGQRQVVVMACDVAQSFGVRPGMTVGEAQALCGPALQNAAHEPQRDLRSLEALARWMSARFSPTVAIEGDSALLLDITGCDRLFHGTHNLVRQVCESLDRMRLHAVVAVASTPGAAYALACAGHDRLIVPPGKPLDMILNKFSIAALRLEPDVIRTLRHLGVDSIGQLIALPRNALPARFGNALLRRLDQALGRIDEPLIPVRIDPTLTDGIEFDGVVPSLETVWIATREILGRMTEELRRRGRGARRIEITIARPYDAPIRKTILLSRPSRDAKSIFNLTRCAIENDDTLSSLSSHWRASGSLSSREGVRVRERSMSNGSSFSNTALHTTPPHPDSLPEGEGEKRLHRIRWETDDGFTAARIYIPVTERLTESQISLLKHEEQAGAQEFDRLLERLHARLGETTVLKPALVESYIPEKACRCSESIDSTNTIGTSCQPVQADFFTSRTLARSTESQPVPQATARGDRPMFLLPNPIEVGVIVAPSDERDGPPLSFTLGQHVHRLLHPSSLERIGGRWWDGHLKTRDYFEAEDASSGTRFWLFRVFETGRWFVHGVFD